jgi:transcriptional regulator with XRE-family HTH domain
LIIDAKCICLLAMSLGGIVARNIRRLRLERGLSQEALAVDAGIDRTYVSRLERGLENPTVSVLEKLARALSSNIEELFRAPRAAEAAGRPPA